ncbi:hypothetical protein CIK05_08160 [Bdellovibrio sp. qaytius]|nr:hypothetical protein CIK05_08160 [Bdellovibrio sp. qaytius]
MIRRMLFLTSILFFTVPVFATWSAWTSLGGSVVGDPAACTGAGQTYVVVKRADNGFWFRKRTNSTGVWDTWQRIPGTIKFSGSPSVSCRINQGLGYFVAYGVGNDGLLYISYQGVVGFVPWYKQSIAGIPSGRLLIGSGLSTPSMPTQSFNPQLFAHASDRSTYWSLCPQGSNAPPCYGTWKLVTGVVASDPAVTYQSPGRLDMVVQGRDGYLYHALQDGLIWEPFVKLSGDPVTSAPDIVSRYQGNLELFVKGQFKNILHRTWINGVWGNWEDLGAVLTSGPGATTYAGGMMVFASAGNGTLWYRAWTP